MMLRRRKKVTKKAYVPIDRDWICDNKDILRGQYSIDCVRDETLELLNTLHVELQHDPGNIVLEDTIATLLNALDYLIPADAISASDKINLQEYTNDCNYAGVPQFSWMR